MRVEWSRRAQHALRVRVEFLERKNPRAAAEMEAVVRSAGDRLAEFPHIGRRSAARPTLLRELVVPFGSGGYVVQYAVTSDFVLITNLKHQREASY